MKAIQDTILNWTPDNSLLYDLPKSTNKIYKPRGSSPGNPFKGEESAGKIVINIDFKFLVLIDYIIKYFQLC